METGELVAELESRGVSINKCEIPRGDFVAQICNEPATRRVNGLYRCDECHVRIVRDEIRAKYEVGAGDFNAKRDLVDVVHRAAMDGKAPEVIARWVAINTGLTWDELCAVEAEVLDLRKMRLWIVAGRTKGRFLSNFRDHVKLVLARTAGEARKMWRDDLYKNRTKDIPNEVEAVEVAGVTEPQVIADRPEFHLEYTLGIHGD